MEEAMATVKESITTELLKSLIHVLVQPKENNWSQLIVSSRAASVVGECLGVGIVYILKEHFVHTWHLYQRERQGYWCQRYRHKNLAWTTRDLQWTE